MRKVLKVQNLISHGDTDVVHCRWVRDCIAQQSLLSLEPK